MIGELLRRVLFRYRSGLKTIIAVKSPTYRRISRPHRQRALYSNLRTGPTQ